MSVVLSVLATPCHISTWQQYLSLAKNSPSTIVLLKLLSWKNLCDSQPFQLDFSELFPRITTSLPSESQTVSCLLMVIILLYSLKQLSSLSSVCYGSGSVWWADVWAKNKPHSCKGSAENDSSLSLFIIHRPVHSDVDWESLFHSVIHPLPLFRYSLSPHLDSTLNWFTSYLTNGFLPSRLFPSLLLTPPPPHRKKIRW